MLPISVAAAIVWAVVFARVVSFFRDHTSCREDDKTIVAGIGAASVLAILAQVLVWVEQPGQIIRTGYAMSLFIGFNLMMAVFMLALVNQYIKSKARACSSPPRR